MASSNRISTLSVFSLVMITVVSVDSIRNLPATALFGSSLVVFFLLGGLFFLVPSAMAAADLSARFPEARGVYDWVKAMFGPRWGLFAVWLQWVENVIWYPTILSFVAGTVGYVVNPGLAKTPWFLTSIILVTFWGLTLLNLRGMRLSSTFSTFCSFVGLFLPMSLIIGAGLMWWWQGYPIAIQWSWSSMLPSFHEGSLWVSLAAIMLSFCGMELATVHANEVKHPSREFPKALVISAGLILCTLMGGSLAIAAVLPHESISLVAGIMQAVDVLFHTFHVPWLLPCMALMLIVGGLGGVSNWIIAPTRGLQVAANDGLLPSWLGANNTRGMPANMLWLQAALVTALSLMYVWMPSIQAAYWLLTALAAQLYMIMYVILFVTCIKASRIAPKQAEAYTIPGGRWGVLVVSSMGVVGASVTWGVSFFSPVSRIPWSHGVGLGVLLTLGQVVMGTPPWWLSSPRLRRWLGKR